MSTATETTKERPSEDEVRNKLLFWNHQQETVTHLLEVWNHWLSIYGIHLNETQIHKKVDATLADISAEDVNSDKVINFTKEALKLMPPGFVPERDKKTQKELEAALGQIWAADAMIEQASMFWSSMSNHPVLTFWTNALETIHQSWEDARAAAFKFYEPAQIHEAIDQAYQKVEYHPEAHNEASNWWNQMESFATLLVNPAIRNKSLLDINQPNAWLDYIHNLAACEWVASKQVEKAKKAFIHGDGKIKNHYTKKEVQ